LTPKQFQKFLARDYGCWHCGESEAVAPHHRINRGAGGSKRRENPANIIIICSVFNSMMESDADAAAWARQCGYKLNSWQDPEKVAVYNQPMNRWFRLGDDWSVVEAEPGGW
jgi:hypothetical protein